MTEQNRTPDLTWAEEIRAEVIAKLRGIKRDYEADAVAKTRIIFTGRLTSAAGNASWRRGLVKLSSYYFSKPQNFGEFRETVLHELAHIAVPGGHSPEWRARLIFLGGTGKRCHSMTSASQEVIMTLGCACGRSTLAVTVKLMKRYSGASILRACGCAVMVPKTVPAIAGLPAALKAKVEKKDGRDLNVVEVFRALKDLSGPEGRGVTVNEIADRMGYWHNTIRNALRSADECGHPRLGRTRGLRGKRTVELWYWSAPDSDPEGEDSED